MTNALPDPGPGGRSLSRRALLRVGWVVPVVLAVGIPRDSFATYDGDPTSSPPPPRDDDRDRDKDKDRGRDRDDNDRDDDKKDKDRDRGGRR